MAQIILKTLTICLLWQSIPIQAQEIWRESFSVPGKGIWGSDDGTILSDFSEVDSWTLEYTNIKLSGAGDYAQTVSTSGGRFEVCDVDGEVVWRSQWINIAGYENICIELISAETGSGSNSLTKYMKVFYRIDGGDKLLFSENGLNAGNWGTLNSKQAGVTGDSLQIVCSISNHYAADKVILDEVVIWNEQQSVPPLKPYDVVINEIMSDPNPPVNLPPVEYIELYNTLGIPVRTNNWELRINQVGKKLKDNWIEPGGYFLLCATAAVDSLMQYGNVSNVPGFQGLLNKGALIEILDAEGNIIDRISYNDTWYGEIDKRRGGWSLERIDPGRHCNQPGNWKASTHANGGTPGGENSVYYKNTDETAPVVNWAIAVSEAEVELVFSEPVDTIVMNDIYNYSITESGNPSNIEIASAEKITLHFLEPFEINKIYTLQINILVDECGNQLSQQQYEVQWNSIGEGDVVINEVLFNPLPGGEDFVEIYNNSGKRIDLSRLFLANRNKEQELNQVFSFTEKRRLLFPEEFLVLTRDTNSVIPWYSIQCPDCFLQMERIPSYPNSEGNVVLLNEEMKVIDEFFYNDKMHSSFLAETKGVSLERKFISKPANSRNNWYSASGDAGYATPGYKNSQVGQETHGKPVITFEPDAFSPNHDGYNDVYIICYQVAKSGFVANISIFDAVGRFVQHLCKNEILGTSGEFLWNGADATGKRHPLGVYIVVVELFNENGDVYRYKDGVVLTNVLE